MHFAVDRSFATLWERSLQSETRPAVNASLSTLEHLDAAFANTLEGPMEANLSPSATIGTETQLTAVTGCDSTGTHAHAPTVSHSSPMQVIQDEDFVHALTADAKTRASVDTCVQARAGWTAGSAGVLIADSPVVDGPTAASYSRWSLTESAQPPRLDSRLCSDVSSRMYSLLVTSKRSPSALSASNGAETVELEDDTNSPLRLYRPKVVPVAAATPLGILELGPTLSRPSSATMEQVLTFNNPPS